jgi:two-component system, OmpR family, sensor histidine kinase CpxA
MQSLFLKIFLWFWAAMVFIIVSMLVVTWVILSPRLQPQVGDPFRMFGNEAAKIYEQTGRAGLAAYLDELDQNLKNPSYLLDETGQELAGRVVVEAVKAAALQNSARREEVIGDRSYFVMHVQAASGRRYIFLHATPDFLSGQLFGTPGRLALQVLVVLLSAGLGCYLLARYLTKPLVRLRAATRQLATGDLSARVGATLAQRRDEATELGREFDRMAERIESLINGQRRLLGDISHELRSPLTRLNLALGVARRQAGDSAIKAHDRIEREAERLNELIGQLLLLTELESGDQPIKREPLQLHNLLADVVADAEFEARTQNRAIRLALAESCTINGDERLLRSALENVVRNAIRHTATDTTVEVTLSQEPQTICITVRDYGPGVSAAALAHLFRPFYRVEEGRDRHSGGTGLGLSIVERAINLHEGEVSAVNAPDQGLLVKIRLPVSANPEPARNDMSGNPRASDESEGNTSDVRCD